MEIEISVLTEILTGFVFTTGIGFIVYGVRYMFRIFQVVGDQG